MKYPCPSSVNFMIYVSARLSFTPGGKVAHFKIWREQMLCLLESQDVLGFVNGEIPQPPGDSDDHKAWRRTDRLVKGWILGCMEEDVADAVWEKESAKEVWSELEKVIFTMEEEEEEEEEKEETRRCSELYNAALHCKWETAENLFPNLKGGAATRIGGASETALHVAVMDTEEDAFWKKMLEMMSSEEVALKDSDGDTALHVAAMVGNLKAAKELVKFPGLVNDLNGCDQPPVLKAALFRQRETLRYLISVSEPSLFQGQLGLKLLCAVITSEYFDVALDLVEKNTDLARLVDKEDGSCALSVIAEMSSVFPSEDTSWWHLKFFQCILRKQSECEPAPRTYAVGDIENRSCNASAYHNYFQRISGGLTSVGKKLECTIWKVMGRLVHPLGKMREKKAKQEKALQLVKKLCHEMLSLSKKKAGNMFLQSILVAAENGMSEIVEEILRVHPSAAFARDGIGRHIFLLAAENRFENLFSMINKPILGMGNLKYEIFNIPDFKGNNMLHLCGLIPLPHRLNRIPGAALQMQRELQWFEEMKDYVHSCSRTSKNRDGRTPEMLFTEEHKHLKKAGEKWMKETASACNIAAALIATVMFAAAFTLPGGLRQDKGLPVFLDKDVSKPPATVAFKVFAVSDAISLFASITSLLTFLSILTSRYAEQDFLRALPKRLALGLLTLFISITFMLAAFGATMYLIFLNQLSWFLIPVAAFACLPVATFVLLQFPLLAVVVASTYNTHLFGKTKTPQRPNH